MVMYSIVRIMKITAFIIAVIILLLTLPLVNTYSAILHSTTSPSLEIFILGEPLANTSYVEMKASFNTPVTGAIELPLVVNGSSIAVINATGLTSDGKKLDLTSTTSFDQSINSIIIMGENIVGLAVKILVYGVFTMEGIDSYSMKIDLSYIDPDANASCTLRILGNYTPIIVSTGRFTVEKGRGILDMRFIDKTSYIIVIYPEIYSEVLSEASSTRLQNNNSFIPDIFWAGIGTAAIVLIIIIVYTLIKKKRTNILITEEILTKDIFSDDVIRSIVRAVGDAGTEGLVQARLPEILGKPKSTISRKIKRLNEEGYINVTRRGKVNILKLTDKGWEAYKKITGKK